MKLKTITEVYNLDNLDSDIKFTDRYGNAFHRFYIKDNEYSVGFHITDIPLRDLVLRNNVDILDEYADDPAFVDFYNSGNIPSVSITLEGPRGFLLTGYGQQHLVYKEMLRALLKYVQIYKPESITFAADHPWMIPVYIRMLEKARSLGEDYDFMPLRANSNDCDFISRRFFNYLPDGLKEEVLVKINSEQNNLNKFVQSIKINKNAQRKLGEKAHEINIGDFVNGGVVLLKGNLRIFIAQSNLENIWVQYSEIENVVTQDIYGYDKASLAFINGLERHFARNWLQNRSPEITKDNLRKLQRVINDLKVSVEERADGPTYTLVRLKWFINRLERMYRDQQEKNNQ